MKILSLILYLLLPLYGFTFIKQEADTHFLKQKVHIGELRERKLSQVNKHRITYAGLISAGSFGVTVAALSNIWYSNYPQRNFHFFNDSRDWLQVDKAGHIFTTYQLGRLHAELWRWAGISEKSRIWVGGLSGTALMSIVEVLDGFSDGWGFSISDYASNLAGSAVYIAQEIGWNEQRIQLKYSFHKPAYTTASANDRSIELFGTKKTETMLKDYNGQTYWASMNVSSFFPASRFPKWFNIAIGYGAEGMLGGTDNVGKNPDGSLYFDGRNIQRYRQWYISPDIDLTRIKTKSKLLKAGFFILNAIKIPAPTIGFSKKGTEWKWLY